MKKFGEKKTLWIIFLLNAAFFVIEGTFGLLSGSTALLSDSLEVFAHSVIFGLSIHAFSKGIRAKQKIAFLAACVQVVMIAALGIDIAHGFIADTPVPEYKTMILVSLFSFVINFITFALLKSMNSRDPNIKACSICVFVDSLISVGVVAGGVLVLLTGSKIPDLVISTMIWIYAIHAVIEMFQVAKGSDSEHCGCMLHNHHHHHSDE